MNENKTVVDRWFRTQSGEIVIAQFPNWPLMAWAIAALLERLAPPEPEITIKILSGVGFLALVYWAWLEIQSGVNLFRKALGGVVLVVSIISRMLG